MPIRLINPQKIQFLRQLFFEIFALSKYLYAQKYFFYPVSIITGESLRYDFSSALCLNNDHTLYGEAI